MNPRKDQCILAYKELKWPIETISTQLDIPISEVQSIIAEEEGIDKLIDITGADTPDKVLSLIKVLSKTTTSDKIKLEAIKYLHNEITGRNNLGVEELILKKKKLQLDVINVGMNLTKFNEGLKRSRELSSAELDSLPKLVEV